MTDQKDTFNLLSIGHRAVGKTVFLAGSYVELNIHFQSDRHPSYWFECQDKCSQDNLNSILNYIAETGNYPPSTLKTSDFYLSLKQSQPRGANTLCHFHWCDIPGEFCHFDNTEFQSMVLNSHSCCVFINAERLLHDPAYEQTMAATIQQVTSIANLIQSLTSPYSFALILTQCDRLGESSFSHLQIEQKLQPLIVSLDAVKANYRRFYSGIPIIDQSGKCKLSPQGSAIALLWLASCLTKQDNSPSSSTLASLIEKSEQALDLNGPPVQSKKRIAIWPFVLGVALVGAALFAWLSSNQLRPKDVAGEAKQDDQLIKQYQSQAERNPRDLEALVMLNNLYIGRGQYEQAIPIIKQIVELEPHSLDWQMTLARVHDLAGQTAVAEQVYKQILRKDPQNFEALFELAKLRQLQGDAANAKLYFQKAEQATTSPSLRAQVRDEIRQLSQ